MKTKTCSKCKQDKPFNQFNKNKNGVFGLSPYCKECRSVMRKVNYKERICLVCKQVFIPKMVDEAYPPMPLVTIHSLRTASSKSERTFCPRCILGKSVFIGIQRLKH